MAPSSFDELRDLPVAPATRILWETLCRLDRIFAAKDSGEFYRSLRDLRRDSGLGYSTIVRGVRILETFGFLMTRRGDPADFNKAWAKRKRPGTVFKLLK